MTPVCNSQNVKVTGILSISTNTGSVVCVNIVLKMLLLRKMATYLVKLKYLGLARDESKDNQSCTESLYLLGILADLAFPVCATIMLDGTNQP